MKDKLDYEKKLEAVAYVGYPSDDVQLVPYSEQCGSEDEAELGLSDALRICREAVQAERGKCAEAFRKRAEESCMTDYAIEEYIQVIKEANNGL